MRLIVNGEQKDFDNEINLHKIIQDLKVEDKVMAAAVNMDIVKKDDWLTFIPKEGDKIELLQFVGGG